MSSNSESITGVVPFGWTRMSTNPMLTWHLVSSSGHPEGIYFPRPMRDANAFTDSDLDRSTVQLHEPTAQA